MVTHWAGGDTILPNDELVKTNDMQRLCSVIQTLSGTWRHSATSFATFRKPAQLGTFRRKERSTRLSSPMAKLARGTDRMAEHNVLYHTLLRPDRREESRRTPRLCHLESCNEFWRQALPGLLTCLTSDLSNSLIKVMRKARSSESDVRPSFDVVRASSRLSCSWIKSFPKSFHFKL
jgi:hypothetical protein